MLAVMWSKQETGNSKAEYPTDPSARKKLYLTSSTDFEGGLKTVSWFFGKMKSHFPSHNSILKK